MIRASAALALLFILIPATPGAAETPTNTPIRHFIVLMQENHSFDNYFGTYPGADGIPPDTCIPIDPTNPDGPCVSPFHMGKVPVEDLPHSRAASAGQFNDGAMDGFVAVARESGSRNDVVMGYYDRRDLPYYWNIADEYVLFDRFFQSAAAGSVQNHMYWVSGQPGSTRDAIPSGGFQEVETIFDRLEERGISWKFYIQNFDPTITYRTRFDVPPNRSAQVVWAPVLAMDRFIDDPKFADHIVDMDEYFRDIEEGTLPAVSYLVPSGASEHPPGSIAAGERFVRTLIVALQRSEFWSTSAFLWTYDDWGGFYDHVPPPQIDEFGYGFRVPALLVSAYARRGHVDHTTLDFTSVLAFIEENWDIAPLAQRDAAANSILSAFDFSSGPRAPEIQPARFDPPRPDNSGRAWVWIVYGALMLGVVVTGGILVARRPE